MSNYSKTAKEDIEKTNYENLELFKRAISEAMTAKNQKLDEEIKDMEMPPLSKRHKIRMNRLFRERTGGAFIPFPEEDSVC